MNTRTMQDEANGQPATDISLIRQTTSPAWCQGTLTRVMELKSLCAWVTARWGATEPQRDDYKVLATAVGDHLRAAGQAAEGVTTRGPLRNLHKGARMERAIGNIDVAEAHLLTIAPADYVFGQMPNLLRHVQCHLVPSDPRRQELERIARKLGLIDPDVARSQSINGRSPLDNEKFVDEERGRIVAAMRGASSAALREQIRVRSFRNVLTGATISMSVLAVAIAVIGLLRPTLIPLCFAPEEAGQAMVVCPTEQSAPFPTAPRSDAAGQPSDAIATDIDDAIEGAANPQDLIVVEFVGIAAAAVAAASAIRGIRGTSERYAVPLLLTALKLPTGAVTAFLGLLLMRGQFVPGLSALDSSAQILAWALVFGYAQQLFTRLVDQQGHTVLSSVRGANTPKADPTPP